MSARMTVAGEAAAADRVAARVAALAAAARAVPGVGVTVTGDRVEITGRGIVRRAWEDPAVRWIGRVR